MLPAAPTRSWPSRARSSASTVGICSEARLGCIAAGGDGAVAVCADRAVRVLDAATGAEKELVWPLGAAQPGDPGLVAAWAEARSQRWQADTWGAESPISGEASLEIGSSAFRSSRIQA